MTRTRRNMRAGYQPAGSYAGGVGDADFFDMDMDDEDLIIAETEDIVREVKNQSAQVDQTPMLCAPDEQPNDQGIKQLAAPAQAILMLEGVCEAPPAEGVIETDEEYMPDERVRPDRHIAACSDMKTDVVALTQVRHIRQKETEQKNVRGAPARVGMGAG